MNIRFSNPDISLRWLNREPENPYVLKEEGLYVAELIYYDLRIIDSIRVRVLPYPNLHLPSDTSLCLGDIWELQLASPPDAERYLWADEGDSPTRLISDPGTYTLSAWNGACKSEDEIVVETFICDDFLEMPNVFSPNGDGINDEFKAIRFQNTLRPQWSVFDRWGRIVFEGRNLSQGWKGTWLGKRASEGTYYWVVQYVDPRGGTHMQKGNLLLLR